MANHRCEQPSHCDLCQKPLTDGVYPDRVYPIQKARTDPLGVVRYFSRVGYFHESCRAAHRAAIFARVRHDHRPSP